MKLLTFNQLSTWRVGKETSITVLNWCKEHCGGKVDEIRTPDRKGRICNAFAFENDADVLLFTLRWR